MRDPPDLNRDAFAPIRSQITLIVSLVLDFLKHRRAGIPEEDGREGKLRIARTGRSPIMRHTKPVSRKEDPSRQAASV